MDSRRRQWLAIGAALLGIGAGPAAAQPASSLQFTPRNPVPGERWVFERRADSSLRLQVRVNGQLVLDNDESSPQQLKLNVEVLALPANAPDEVAGLWRIAEAPAQEGEREKTYLVLRDAAGAWYYGRSERIEELFAGDAGDLGNPVEPAAAGILAWACRAPSLATALPPAALVPGDQLTIPSATAEQLLQLGAVELGPLLLTLEEVLQTPEGTAGRFRAEVTLARDEPMSQDHDIPSRLEARLEGVALLLARGGAPVSFSLSGAMTATGAGERDGLAITLEGSGRYALDLSWKLPGG